MYVYIYIYIYIALEEVYHPLCAPILRSVTL